MFKSKAFKVSALAVNSSSQKGSLNSLVAAAMYRKDTVKNLSQSTKSEGNEYPKRLLT